MRSLIAADLRRSALQEQKTSGEILRQVYIGIITQADTLYTVLTEILNWENIKK